MNQIHATIITIPERMDIAKALSYELEFGGAEVTIFNDEDHKGYSFNTRRAYEFLGKIPAKDIGLFCTDDCASCKNALFCVEQTYQTLKSQKGDLDFFVTGNDWTSHAAEQCAKGARWLVGNRYYDQAGWAAGQTWAKFVKWLETVEVTQNYDDYAICAFSSIKKFPVFCPLPCPFQHALPSDSVMGHANKNRYCKCSLAPDKNALDYQWRNGGIYKVKSAPVAKSEYMKSISFK